MSQRVLEAAKRPCLGSPYRYVIRLHLHLFAKDLAKKELTLLDVGCGKGDYPRVFNGFHATRRYLGGDLNRYDSNWRKVRNELSGGLVLDYLCLDALHLPFKEDSFDVILCIAVLEHIKDDGAAVAEIARVLKRGGVVYAWVPSKYSWLLDFGMHGYHFYSKEGIAKLFQASNLAIKEIKPTGGFFCLVLTCLINWLRLAISAVALAFRIRREARVFLASGVDRCIARWWMIYDRLLKYCVRKDFVMGNRFPGGYSVILEKRRNGEK